MGVLSLSRSPTGAHDTLMSRHARSPHRWGLECLPRAAAGRAVDSVRGFEGAVLGVFSSVFLSVAAFPRAVHVNMRGCPPAPGVCGSVGSGVNGGSLPKSGRGDAGPECAPPPRPAEELTASCPDGAIHAL